MDFSLPPEKPLAERIRAARKALGLSRDQAAKKWGISFYTLRSWEEEARNPAGLYRDKIERILRKIEGGKDK